MHFEAQQNTVFQNSTSATQQKVWFSFTCYYTHKVQASLVSTLLKWIHIEWKWLSSSPGHHAPLLPGSPSAPLVWSHLGRSLSGWSSLSSVKETSSRMIAIMCHFWTSSGKFQRPGKRFLYFVNSQLWTSKSTSHWRRCCSGWEPLSIVSRQITYSPQCTLPRQGPSWRFCPSSPRVSVGEPLLSPTREPEYQTATSSRWHCLPLWSPLALNANV